MKFDIMSSDLSNDFQFVFDHSSAGPLADRSSSSSSERLSNGQRKAALPDKQTLKIPLIIILDESEQIIRKTPTESDNEENNADFGNFENSQSAVSPQITSDETPQAMQHTNIAATHQPITEQGAVQEIEISMERKRSNHRFNNAPFSNNEAPKAAAVTKDRSVGKLKCGYKNRSSQHRPRSNTVNTKPNRPTTKRRGTDQSLPGIESRDETIMKRRSFSHPDQLNLIVTEDESCHHGLSNGGLVNRSNSISSSHHRRLSSASHDHDFSHRPSVLSDDTESGGLIREEESFSPLLPDSEPVEGNLWSHRPSEFKLRDQLYSFFQASDNKLAMKLFGSRNALLKEKRRQMAAKTWIIHPCSNFR